MNRYSFRSNYVSGFEGKLPNSIESRKGELDQDQQHRG
jgi:hypothetical protein